MIITTRIILSATNNYICHSKHIPNIKPPIMITIVRINIIFQSITLYFFLSSLFIIASYRIPPHLHQPAPTHSPTLTYPPTLTLAPTYLLYIAMIIGNTLFFSISCCFILLSTVIKHIIKQIINLFSSILCL